MGFNCGIVGLPNVGKSTIFNALTAASVSAANYPFCTIEPNTGIVPVPDPRLDVLANMAESAKIIPTTIEFVDIAGLVKGASEGEGLGNQFLGHIRAVDAIAHVVRCFDDPNVVHVEGKISPLVDVEIIETELLLADLGSVEARLDRARRAAKGGNREAKLELESLEIAEQNLKVGTSLREIPDAEGRLAALGLITSKPVLYVANVSERDCRLSPDESASGYVGELARFAKERGAPVVVICGLIEAEVAQLASEERKLFLHDLGLETAGLDRLALAGYQLLNLITFFTVGPKEAHAWTCLRSTNARAAAGKIHTDFEKGFIRAEVISYSDFVDSGGEVGARERGLLRIEGKEYLVQDGDIMHFRFNV